MLPIVVPTAGFARTAERKRLRASVWAESRMPRQGQPPRGPRLSRLPHSRPLPAEEVPGRFREVRPAQSLAATDRAALPVDALARSEERRVGKECRCRWAADRYKRKESASCDRI